jgi:hypothetical protein
VFLTKSKDGDYHQEMNSVVFLEWFENQLMPALKNPSLDVLDNASYHNVKRGYFWGIRPIIRKPHIICAVILVNPCFIHVYDIIPCFPKRFDLSQIITPFENQLMPALKNPSLDVLDNASYHNVKTEDTVCPNFSQKKAVLQNYLTQLAVFFFNFDHMFFCFCPHIFCNFFESGVREFFNMF